jgi:hypothetical protein
MSNRVYIFYVELRKIDKLDENIENIWESWIFKLKYSHAFALRCTSGQCLSHIFSFNIFALMETTFIYFLALVINSMAYISSLFDAIILSILDSVLFQIFIYQIWAKIFA